MSDTAMTTTELSLSGSRQSRDPEVSLRLVCQIGRVLHHRLVHDYDIVAVVKDCDLGNIESSRKVLEELPPAIFTKTLRAKSVAHFRLIDYTNMLEGKLIEFICKVVHVSSFHNLSFYPFRGRGRTIRTAINRITEIIAITSENR